MLVNFKVFIALTLAQFLQGHLNDNEQIARFQLKGEILSLPSTHNFQIDLVVLFQSKTTPSTLFFCHILIKCFPFLESLCPTHSRPVGYFSPLLQWYIILF